MLGTSVCGFFEYYWYIRQRETPEDWKCQPRRWLSDADQQHEILSGTCNMMMAGTILGSAAYWVYIGGTCALYFNPLDYGASASPSLVWCCTDGVAKGRGTCR